MKPTIKHAAYFTASLFVAMQAPAHAGDAEAGKWKAQTCLGCHGVPSYTNVYPTYHVPRLAGQHADYIVAALQAYKSGERSHETMVAQSHNLGDQDIADVAAYFASFGSAPANPGVKPPAELQDLVTVCSACHNNDGNSPIPLYPKIAGQHEDYLYRALLDYKTGKRTNPIMLGIIATLEDDDMKALSRYFAAHPGLSSIDVGTSAEYIRPE